MSEIFDMTGKVGLFEVGLIHRYSTVVVALLALIATFPGLLYPRSDTSGPTKKRTSTRLAIYFFPRERPTVEEPLWKLSPTIRLQPYSRWD
jgi:hypothetical protein